MAENGDGKGKKFNPAEEEAKGKKRKVSGDKPVPARVLFCENCGSSRFKEKKWNKGPTLVLECEKCGTTAKAKGTVGLIEHDEADLVRAEQNAPVPPDDDEFERAGAGGKKVESEWVNMRFKMTRDQRQIVRLAMECSRFMIGLGEGEKMWHGSAIEWIAADFLAGAPPDVVQQVMEDLVKRKGKMPLAKGVLVKLTKPIKTEKVTFDADRLYLVHMVEPDGVTLNDVVDEEKATGQAFKCDKKYVETWMPEGATEGGSEPDADAKKDEGKNEGPKSVDGSELPDPDETLDENEKELIQAGKKLEAASALQKRLTLDQKDAHNIVAAWKPPKKGKKKKS